MTDYLEFTADLQSPELAHAFDELTFWSSLFGQLLFRHLDLSPGLTALDVGCATGFPLFELADRLGPRSTVHGIDSWTQATARARLKARVRGCTNVHVTDGDAADMPYADETFELIVSNLGINNFADPPAVMTECRRICQPGGRIALTTNLVGHMREFYEVFEQTLVDLGLSSLIDRLERQEAHRATIGGLRELFESASIEVTKCETETFELCYSDGSAFLRAYLTKLGFLDGWKGVLDDSKQAMAVFDEIETRLNRLARTSDGGLRLSIPAAYVEGQRR